MSGGTPTARMLLAAPASMPDVFPRRRCSSPPSCIIAKHEFAQHGITIGDIKLDLAQMQKRRATIVKTMTNGIASLLKAAGAVGIQGHGRLLPGNSVQVTAPDGSQKTLQAKHVVLASGSTPIRLAAAPHDGKFIVDSWNALEFDAVPRRLGVIGAGVIGL